MIMKTWCMPYLQRQENEKKIKKTLQYNKKYLISNVFKLTTKKKKNVFKKSNLTKHCWNNISQWLLHKTWKNTIQSLTNVPAFQLNYLKKEKRKQKTTDNNLTNMCEHNSIGGWRTLLPMRMTMMMAVVVVVMQPKLRPWKNIGIWVNRLCDQ